MKSAPPRSPNVPQRKDLTPSNLNFPVVGIGASAGGLQAVKAFFEHMPRDCGMAFVVILHLSPDHQSVAGKIIQETTRMPVSQVNDATPIEKNHVYVISPAQLLKMNDGYLAVSPSVREGGPHIAIDLFFRDLADTHKERAFCLILSGTGSDGAVGLSRIKEQGGITLVQAPEDAEYDGMPLAAIETQMVDLVLPVVEMPQKLLELWRNAQSIVLPTMEREVSAARVGFAGILARLADVVAAMVVRGWVECACGNASGLVAALRDPRLAGALLALHQQPGRDWTVAQLAEQCNTSRSAFADRFQVTIGMTPLRYVTELRMRLASQWLTLERLPIEEVAQRLGYTSQAAFSRAFKRITGKTPGLSRKVRQPIVT